MMRPRSMVWYAVKLTSVFAHKKLTDFITSLIKSFVPICGNTVRS